MGQEERLLILWIELTAKANRIINQVKAVLEGVAPGHIAGCFLILVALFIFDDRPVGVVLFIESSGISPRWYGLLLAACGCVLLMAPRYENALLLITPLTFYALMAWIYFLSMPPGQRILVAPLLYSGCCAFMSLNLLPRGSHG